MGIDFLRTNRSDAVFSKVKNRTDREKPITILKKQFFLDKKQVNQVVVKKYDSSHKHVMIVPGTRPNWKTPPVARIVLLEPRERFMDTKKQMAQDALFSFENGIVPMILANKNIDTFSFFTAQHSICPS